MLIVGLLIWLCYQYVGMAVTIRPMTEKDRKKVKTKSKIGAKARSIAQLIVKSISKSKAKTKTKTDDEKAVEVKKKTRKPKSRVKDKGKGKPRAKRGRGKKSDNKSKGKRSKKGSIVDPDAKKEAGRYENPIASRQLILKLINQYHTAMTMNELLDQLDMTSDDQYEALRRRLRAMVRDGQLVQNRRGGYISVDEDDLIRGRVIAHPDGFGFLVPEEGGDDLFMSARQMRTLLHGDRAVVQVAGIDRRGRREGSVISIIERANLYMVGQLSDDNGIYSVTPDNKRLTQDILLPAGELAGAVVGQIVKVEITQQPTFKKKMVGKVVSVIGNESAPGMEIEIAIHNHGLPNEWPDEVLAESSKLGEEVKEEDKQGRTDLRSIPLVTIDGEDARDFDDAVYCERSGSSVHGL